MNRPGPTSQGIQGAAAYGRLVVHPGGGRQEDDPAARSRVALALLLAAMTMIFASIISAYLVRMDLSDWQAAPLPQVLWINTALLIGASIALQAALGPAQAGDAGRLGRRLWVAGLCTAAFIAGQIAAWQQLRAMGYGVAATPGSSFFYLFTAIHGLHVLGGLVPWVRLLLRLRAVGAAGPQVTVRAGGDAAGTGEAAAALTSALRLCAVYWHFLLGVWVLMLALMLLS